KQFVLLRPTTKGLYKSMQSRFIIVSGWKPLSVKKFQVQYFSPLIPKEIARGRPFFKGASFQRSNLIKTPGVKGYFPRSFNKLFSHSYSGFLAASAPFFSRRYDKLYNYYTKKDSLHILYSRAPRWAAQWPGRSALPPLDEGP